MMGLGCHLVTPCSYAGSPVSSLQHEEGDMNPRTCEFSGKGPENTQQKQMLDFFILVCNELHNFTDSL